MEALYPAYYPEFHCLVGACPDSCCQGDWEIVLDEEALALYAKVDGLLGQAIRKAITVDEEGDQVLAMENGRCPLWDADGLCRIQRNLGAEALCRTCFQFPRIVQDYEAFAEHDLSLACPAAAALVLSRPSEPPVREGTLDPWADAYDGALMELLRETRPGALALLRGEKPFSEKLADLYRYTAQVQQKINGGAFPESPAAEPHLPALLRFYRELEILTEPWRALLEEALDRCPTKQELDGIDAENLPLERWAEYFLRRYWYQAVADEDLEEKVQKLLAAWALLRALLAVLGRHGGGLREHFLSLVQLYAKEVEHDEDNQEALRDALLCDPAFSSRALLAMA